MSPFKAKDGLSYKGRLFKAGLALTLGQNLIQCFSRCISECPFISKRQRRKLILIQTIFLNKLSKLFGSLFEFLVNLGLSYNQLLHYVLIKGIGAKLSEFPIRYNQAIGSDKPTTLSATTFYKCNGTEILPVPHSKTMEWFIFKY